MHYNRVYNNLLVIRLLRFQAGDVHPRGAELSEAGNVRDLGVGLHPAAIVSDRLRPTHPRERVDAPDVRRHGLRRLRRRCHDVVRRRSERRQRSRHQDQNLALESGFRICVRLGQEGPGSGDLNSSFIFMFKACVTHSFARNIDGTSLLKLDDLKFQTQLVLFYHFYYLL